MTKLYDASFEFDSPKKGFIRIKQTKPVVGEITFNCGSADNLIGIIRQAALDASKDTRESQ